jgi:Domain of unknown function (DUF4062)
MKWKTMKIFISSTFQDMHAERDYLVKKIFPKLREELQKYWINIIDIDLRWGITNEEVKHNRVIKLLFEEIDNCRPFFLGILGARYGWVPNKIPDTIEEEYSISQIYKGKSITEMEILYGVLNDKSLKVHAYFYIRNRNSLVLIPDNIRKKYYIEANKSSMTKLNQLKATLRDNGYCIHDDYTASWNPDKFNHSSKTVGCLEKLNDFGERVYADLMKGIEKEENLKKRLALIKETSLIEQYDDMLEQFIDLRLDLYSERKDLQNKIHNYFISNGNKPLFIYGIQGSGITSLLAWVTRNINVNYRYDLIYVFGGVTADSNSLLNLLSKINNILEAKYNLGHNINGDFNFQLELLHSTLKMIPADDNLIIIIDGIECFEEKQVNQDLIWIPNKLANNINIVIGCSIENEDSSRFLNSANELGFEIISMGTLNIKERLEIIDKLPSIYSRTLDSEQVNLLCNNPATKNPLYLTIALEELRGFGAYDKLEERISNFPDPVRLHVKESVCLEMLFKQIIKRLEHEFDGKLVKELLTLLACSYYGLRENILKKIISEQFDNTEEFYYVLRQIRCYLLVIQNRICLFNSSFKIAIIEEFLTDIEYYKSQHLKLANCYNGLGDEKAFHLYESEEWDELGKTLSSIYNFTAYYAKNKNILKNMWKKIERNTGKAIPLWFDNTLRMTFVQAIKLVNRDNLFLTNLECLANFFSEMGYMKESEKTKEFCFSLYSKMGSNSSINVLINQAVDLIVQNNIEGALTILNRAEIVAKEKNDYDSLYAVNNRKAQIMIKIKKYEDAFASSCENDKIIEKVNNKTEKLENKLIKGNIKYHQKEYGDAMDFYKDTESEANRFGDRSYIAKAYIGQAQIFKIQNKNTEALKILGDASSILYDLEDYELLTHVMYQQSEIYRNDGDIESSLSILLDEEDVCREFMLEKKMETNLGLQGVIYLERKEYDRALKCFQEQEMIIQKKGSDFDFQRCFGNQAAVYVGLKKYKEAFELLKKKETICKKTKSELCEIEVINVKANILFQQNKYNDALILYKKQECLSRKIGHISYIIVSLLNQAHIYMKVEATVQRAERSILEAFELTKSGNITKALISEIHKTKNLIEKQKAAKK